jgi:CelD/BcsL family acetyltransferase involved in cellulose biosynthesis
MSSDTVTILAVRSASSDEWDAIFQACDYSTYFHSREWAEIWNVYTRNASICDPKLITFSDGKQALLPISYQKSMKGLSRRYVSSPAGTFGGWISSDKLAVAHAEILFRYMRELSGNLVWRINPYDSVVFQTSSYAETSPANRKNDVTHTLHLEEGFDAVYERWSKGKSSAARKVRKARKEGIEIRCALGKDDWSAYYQVYEKSLQRWGERASSVYTWDLFQELFRRNSPHVKLWLALYQQEIIAGALCFSARNHVVYWHGAALEAFFPLRPVNLLMYEAIKDACEQGYSWFDFNPSGGHEGVKKFKESFGAVAKSSPVFMTRNRPTRFIEHVLFMLRKLKHASFA